MQRGKGAGYILLFTLLFASSLTYANDSYSYSLTGLYDNTSFDDDLESTGLLAGLQIFYQAVSLGRGPYEEAAFLDRQTNFGLALGTQESTYNGESLAGTLVVLTAEYADQSHPYTLGLVYSSNKADDSVSGIDVETSLETLSFQIGAYLNPHSRLLLDIGQITGETTIGNSITTEDDADSYGLTYKNVMSLDDSHAVSILAGFDIKDYDSGIKTTITSLQLDNYLNDATSVIFRADLYKSDNALNEGTIVNFGVRAFIKTMTAVGIMFEKFSAKKAGNDYETVIVTLEHRIN